MYLCISLIISLVLRPRFPRSKVCTFYGFCCLLVKWPLEMCQFKLSTQFYKHAPCFIPSSLLLIYMQNFHGAVTNTF